MDRSIGSKGVPSDRDRDRSALMANRRVALFVVAVLLLSVAGVTTGAALDGEKADVAANQLEPRSDGSLEVTPRPLTLADVAAADDGSAARVVLELIFWGQWGSAPNVVAAYAPAVERAVGARDLSAVYAAQRVYLLRGRPRITGTVTRRGEARVAVDILRRKAAPERHAFRLRRVAGRWRLVHDTLLDQGLASLGLTPLAAR